MIKRIKYCLVCFLLLACTKKPSPSETIAALEGRKITFKEVDEAVKHQLYERLYDIYKVRKIALDKIIERELLQAEGSVRGIPLDSVIYAEIDSKVIESNLTEFVRDHNLENGISPPDNPFRLIDINTDEGRQLLVECYKEYLRDRLIDSLMVVHDVKINLSIPKPPAVKLDLTRLPLNSPNNPSCQVDYVADIECVYCRKYFPTIKKLIKEYGETIQFNFVPNNPDTPFSSLLGVYMGMSNKFEEFFDVVIEEQVNDSLGYINSLAFIDTTPTDALEFIKDNNIRDRLYKNSVLLKENNITSTPTLIVNGRVYYGLFEYLDVKQFIDEVRSIE